MRSYSKKCLLKEFPTDEGRVQRFGWVLLFTLLLATTGCSVSKEEPALATSERETFSLNGENAVVSLVLKEFELSTVSIRRSNPSIKIIESKLPRLSETSNFTLAFIFQALSAQPTRDTESTLISQWAGYRQGYRFVCRYREENRIVWCGISDGQKAFGVKASVPNSTSELQHVAFSRRGETLYLFINGELKDSRVFSAGLGSTVGTGPLNLGSRFGRSYHWHGDLGDIRMWNGALPESVVAKVSRFSLENTRRRSNCGGASVGGYCFYRVSENVSCMDYCAARGGYDPGTEDYIGPRGSADNCGTVLEALGFDLGSPRFLFTRSLNSYVTPEIPEFSCYTLHNVVGRYYSGIWIVGDSDFDPSFAGDSGAVNPVFHACGCNQ